MGNGHIWGLPSHEIIIPIICWTLFLLQYLYLFLRGAFTNAFDDPNVTAADYPFLFFSKARRGWVTQNFLTGQASANSTRFSLLSTLPTTVLLLRNAQRLSSCDPFLRWQCRRSLCHSSCQDLKSFLIVLGILVIGYTVAAFQRRGDNYQRLRSFQLAFLSFLLFVIFFLFLYSTRFALHHQYAPPPLFHSSCCSFLMNVKFVDDVPMHLPVIQRVFEKSYAFYTAGLRMYFALIPMFAWLVSNWLLLSITLPHLYLVYSYDDMGFIKKEVREMYSAYQPLLLHEDEDKQKGSFAPSVQENERKGAVVEAINGSAVEMI